MTMESKKRLRILLIEDSDNDAQLLLRELRRLGYDVDSERVEFAPELQSALTHKTWDLIICDYSLPRLTAPVALQILKSSKLDLPFIIVSGTIGEESAVNALKAGAHDFIIKGKYARLGPAIERELREAEIRRDRTRAEESLREKERLLSEAQRIGHIGSWSLDIAHNTLQYSDEMYRLLDISAEDFQHTREGFLNLIFSEDQPKAARWMDEINTGIPTQELEFRIFHANGELHYIQCRGASVFNDAGLAERFVGTAQDISERKFSELKIRQQIAHLTALRTIDQAITSSFDMRFTLDVILSQLVTQLQVDAAGILLLHPNEQILKYIATRGLRAPLIMTARLGISDSYAGRAVTERRLVQIENLKIEPQREPMKTLLPEEDFTSYHGVPLIIKGKVTGVLEVFQRAPLMPSPEWISFLETLAGQAAIAIDNAILFENLQRSNHELQQAYDATIEGWSYALDLRDKETEGHTRRVTGMALKLARLMGVEEEKLIHMRRGGLLHDIGKMGVPDNILLKPTALTDEEWRIMRQHPEFAHDWLTPIAYLREVVEIPYSHHEKWDGSGYPRALLGEAIPLASRIFAIADVWDALTSDRPYRPAWSREKAISYLRENTGLHFDPQVVKIFLDNIDELIMG